MYQVNQAESRAADIAIPGDDVRSLDSRKEGSGRTKGLLGPHRLKRRREKSMTSWSRCGSEHDDVVHQFHQPSVRPYASKHAAARGQVDGSHVFSRASHHEHQPPHSKTTEQLADETLDATSSKSVVQGTVLAAWTRVAPRAFQSRRDYRR